MIGHQRPDTDAIASALGYAWYLNQIGQTGAYPRAPGSRGSRQCSRSINSGQRQPHLLNGVAPTFGHCSERDRDPTRRSAARRHGARCGG